VPGITLSASQATTSGTQFDFTGIPSWAKEINVVLESVSLSGTDAPIVQLGDAGGLETTGYVSTCVESNTGSGSMSSTAGFVIRSILATNAASGVMTIRKLSGNMWVATVTGRSNSTTCFFGGGVKTLSATLTRVALLAAGANTFDGGSVAVSYC
jgi:hypothetical protein